MLRTLFLFIMLCTQVVNAQEIHSEKLDGIASLIKKVEALNLPVADTVFVFDCDGVLTNFSTPNRTAKVESRGDAVKFVNQLHAHGYSVVVSSAWPAFHETEARVKLLGLAQQLDMQEGAFERAHVADFVDKQILNSILERDYARYTCKTHGDAHGMTEKRITHPLYSCTCLTQHAGQAKLLDDKGVHYLKNGRVVSVTSYLTQSKKAANLASTNFRQKALSPMVAFPGRQFKYVVFVDDSSDNLTFFREDVKEAAYAQNAHVYMFELPKINGVQSKQDKVADPMDISEASTSRDLRTPGLVDDSEGGLTGSVNAKKRAFVENEVASAATAAQVVQPFLALSLPSAMSLTAANFMTSSVMNFSQTMFVNDDTDADADVPAHPLSNSNEGKKQRLSFTSKDLGGSGEGDD